MQSLIRSVFLFLTRKIKLQWIYLLFCNWHQLILLHCSSLAGWTVCCWNTLKSKVSNQDWEISTWPPQNHLTRKKIESEFVSTRRSSNLLVLVHSRQAWNRMVSPVHKMRYRSMVLSSIKENFVVPKIWLRPFITVRLKFDGETAVDCTEVGSKDLLVF